MTSSKLVNFDVKEKRIGTTSLVSVALVSWNTSEDGCILLTPEMTSLEIDANIQFLKDELDLIAKKAKVIAQ